VVKSVYYSLLAIHHSPIVSCHLLSSRLAHLPTSRFADNSGSRVARYDFVSVTEPMRCAKFFACIMAIASWLWGQVTSPVSFRCVFLSEGGTPLANVRVQADIIPAPPAQGYQSGTRGMTDGQGQFLVILPDRRPWWVVVGVEGAAFFVDASKPESLQPTIKCWLGAKPSLVCTVEGEASKAALFLRLRSSNWWVRLPQFKDNQLLLFNLPSGEHQLVLTPAHVVSYWNDALSLQPPLTVKVSEGETVFVNIKIPPMGSIVGRVIGSDARLIPNAIVTLTKDDYGQTTASSDPQGNFRFEGLPEGKYKLLVVASDFEPTEHSISVKANETVEVTIALKPQQLGIVRGRVVSSDGKVPREGRIWVERILSPTMRQPANVLLWQPSDGKFETKLPPGTYLLVAQSGGRRVSKQIKVEVGQLTDVGDLVLPAPAVVEGIVKSKVPLVNTKVRVVALSGSDDPLQPQWGSIVVEMPVSPDGRFQVEVPTEPVAIVLLPFGMNKPIWKQVHAKAGQKVTVQFELPTTGAIEGQVVRADTGQPVAGALVYLQDETGMTVGQAITNRLGMYRFEPLLPGRYSLRCQAQGLAMGFKHNVTVAEGTRVPVDFVLTTGGTIIGRVKTKSGQTLRMYVMLNADTNFMASVMPDGRFRIDNITPGRHIVMLFRLGEQVGAKEVIVRSGETVEVVFEVP
jgi:hypothetical protein